MINPLLYRRRRSLLLVSTILAFVVFHAFYDGESLANRMSGVVKQPQRKELVVASIVGEDTSWIEENLPDWGRNVYVTDDPGASLTVPVNKGHEAMVYLTFIIDNYLDLPEFMVFMHSLRYQWHNDDPIYDGIPMLQNLQLSHLSTQGYLNLRCVWTFGCPSEISPWAPNNLVGEAYASAFAALFPGTPIPDVVGVSCCAQFALTRGKVLVRPREDYIRYREWLTATPLADDISGRILEYAWHIIFGMPAVHCPDAESCYCNTFGMCNLTCTEDVCEGRYTVPPSLTLPEGWPEVGW